MSRQRPDPLETVPSLGPLFERPLARLASPADPSTSLQAAVQAQGSGELSRARRLALAWVRRHPGQTTKELGLRAYVFYGRRDPEWWRQRIGRRLNELLAGGLVRRDGERDGCRLWWPEGGTDAEGSA